MTSERRCSLMTKTELRASLLQKRQILEKDKKRELELEIESRFLLSEEYRACDTVITYVSTDNEIDTLGVISAAFANNKRVAVPKTNDDYSLSFYYINSFEELKNGKFGISEPSEKCEKVTSFENSVCVIPALCCDLSGNRVGYGKGCYDRFLKDYTGKKICFVYSDNVLPEIVSDPTDVAVDIIVCDSYIKYT